MSNWKKKRLTNEPEDDPAGGNDLGSVSINEIRGEAPKAHLKQRQISIEEDAEHSDDEEDAEEDEVCEFR